MTSSLNEGRKSVMEGSDQLARRGNFGSNLDRTFKRERLRFNPRREVAALVLPQRRHSQGRWLTEVGASVRYSLRLRAVLSSNQSGGRGVLTKRFFGQRRSLEDGMRQQGLSSCSRQWREGAPRGCFNWAPPNRCGTTSASSSGSRHGPKHRREAALCVGAAARV
jgi:hypothetical protein